MKKGSRVLAIDDAPFSFDDDHTSIIGVLTRGPHYVEAILRDKVKVDGLDSTDRIITMISESGLSDQVALLLLDGASFGGFNVFDVHRLNDTLTVPVITITRRQPDLTSMKEALKANFEDWKKRYAILSQGVLDEVLVNDIPVYVKRRGISLRETRSLLNGLTERGGIPESLRLAHMIATVMKKRVSGGRA